MQERVDECAAATRVLVLAGAGVHHHACWLVDAGEVGVFIDDVERDVFRLSLERRGVRFTGDDHVFAAAELERGLGVSAVDKDVALIEEELNARAAYAGELRGEEVIE